MPTERTAISWRDSKCNINLYKLHPLMLSKEGFDVQRNVSQGRGYHAKSFLINFDRQYVKHRFFELINQLQFRSKEEMKAFLQELAE